MAPSQCKKKTGNNKKALSRKMPPRKKTHLKVKKNYFAPFQRKRALQNAVKRQLYNAAVKYGCTVSSLDSCQVSLMRDELHLGSSYQIIRREQSSFFIRRPRVISLFDGICAGLVALRELGVSPEVYLSSEIDNHCRGLQRFNFEENVVQLGDICDLDYERLQSFGHIDLLFGGSPCNDFSGANPNRKGLYDKTGTGVLFFQFLKIHQYLKVRASFHNKNYHWFYENVASMSKDVKDEISRHFGCQPIKLDAKSWTGMKRARYFWTNLHVTEVERMALQEAGSSVENKLQDFLVGSGRKAQVECLPTFTSNLTNLTKGGKKPIHDVDLGPCNPHYSEIENLLGLPVNFTAGPNTPLAIRKKMLAKTWDVHSVKLILKPIINSLLVH